MKLVHAADLHLDSPLRGLAKYDGAPAERIRGATRQAMENLVALCIEEDAALLLIAGDVFDGAWKDHGTGLFFVRQLARLRAAGVRVVWIRGNHDAASEVRRHLQLPEGVTELATRAPQTLVLEDIGVAVHGQGFAHKEVTESLVQAYPKRRADLFNVGLLHTALTGRPGHDSYAPCSVEMLAAKGYDYWALGHVHQREEVSHDPWVVFPGNLQGRHARETGAKGATLIEVESGRVQRVEHRALDVVRWAVCEIDASGAAHRDDVLLSVREALAAAAADAEGRLLAARVVIHGETPAHAALAAEGARFVEALREIASDVGDGEAWLEKVKLEISDPVALGDVILRDDAVGQLARSLAALKDDDDALAALAAELSELSAKLPVELTEGEDGVALDLDAVRAALPDVERRLLTELSRGGTP